MKKFLITIVTTLLFTLGVSLSDIEASPAYDKQVVVDNNNNGDAGGGGGNNLTRTAANVGDNDVDYGWLGLLGLIGLAGARGRNRGKA